MDPKAAERLARALEMKDSIRASMDSAVHALFREYIALLQRCGCKQIQLHPF